MEGHARIQSSYARIQGRASVGNFRNKDLNQVVDSINFYGPETDPTLHVSLTSRNKQTTMNPEDLRRRISLANNREDQNSIPM